MFVKHCPFLPAENIDYLPHKQKKFQKQLQSTDD